MRGFRDPYGPLFPPDDSVVYIVPRFIIFLYLLTAGNHKGVSARSKASTPSLPVFRNTPSSFTYRQGDMAVLYCSIINLGARKVIWRKAAHPNPLTVGEFTYVADDRYTVHNLPDKGEWNLFIKNIQPSDAGMYECQISSKEKYIRKPVQLRVEEILYSDRDIQLDGPHQAEKGRTLTLTCKATNGKSAPDDLDWLKDNHKLVTDKAGRINITKHISYVTMTIVSNLTIRYLMAEDAGVYVCRTSNEMLSNTTVVVTGATSDKDKRTILQTAESASSGSSSMYVYNVINCYAHRLDRYLIAMFHCLFLFFISLPHL